MAVIVTHSEGDTVSLGRRFAKRLKPGDVVALYGELGTGKTRFIKGVCEGLGVHEHVTSPTFTIINEYECTGGVVYHFDFYRVDSLDDIRDTGFEEYLTLDGICLIEWADRARPLLPDHRYDITFSPGTDENCRNIVIEEPTTRDESKTLEEALV